MDEELVKRNTDCVYFLASPLTCKKGIECEYRHSEIARLNPRDCWYWLAGNCLNSGCAFRHPPLVAHNDASSGHAPQQYQYSVPVNKTSIPCYFHFNGFCNKGDRCSFLHDLDDSTPGWKSMKTVPAVTITLPLENKKTEGIDTGSEPTEPHHNSCEIVHKGAAEISIKSKEDGHQSATCNLSKSAYLHLSASEFEDAVAAESLFPPECIIQNRSLLCADQSSEEKLDGHIEGGKWLDSSPGFDVLVDDTFWNVGYEDDQEYLLAQDREGRELNSHVFGNDYEEQAAYDLDYPDSEIMYEVDAHDTYFDNEHTYSNGSKVPGRLKGRILDPMSPNKRNFLPMELFVDCWRGIDLRDHLNKSRMINGHHMGHISRRHDSSRLIGGTRERSQQHCSQWLHGRLAKDADNSTITSYCENEIPLKGANKRSKFRYSRIKMSRNHCKEKRQAEDYFLLSNISQKHASKRRRSTKGYAIFTGRNTLMKIKERRKSKENGDFSGKMVHSGRITWEDFQGPKPLSEILKNKRRMSSVIEGNN